MGEQDLSDDLVSNGDAADRCDLIRSFTGFDYGLAFDAGPGVVIERRMTAQTVSADLSNTML
jgi:hypothetical protein